MKQDIYQTITDRIVSQIEAGTKPWEMPWAGATGRVSRPLRHNGLPYSGVNILILWIAASEKGYASQYWMTYKQATELGGQVRKGEKAQHIVYANSYSKTETGTDGEETERNVSFLRSYAVFNADQIESLPAHYYPTPATAHRNEEARREVAEAFAKASGADIRHGGDRAFYTPAHDFVQMPRFEQFRSSEDYYSTLFHEMTHWTKAESRLNREFGRKRWGDEGYAMEELVAELGASFLCADLGLEPATTPRDDHASYLANWLQVLKNDKRAIFTAASYASKAAEYLHSLQAAPVAEAA
ncbi:MAG TPA: zincin-like metallopeptidase domain-containing protein [Terriglobia bacterium]|nr:zincin-like metallopeptidase domain-containing protein [Terriglobia bacterium]